VSLFLSSFLELLNGRAYAPHAGDAALSLGRRFEGESVVVIGGGGTAIGWTQQIEFDRTGTAKFSRPRSASFKRGSPEWREHLAQNALVSGWAVLLIEQQWQATASPVSGASFSASAVEQMLRVREAIADFGDDRLSEDAVRVAIDHPTMDGSIVAGVRAAIIDSLEREAMEAGFQIAGIRIAAIAILEKFLTQLQRQRLSPNRSLVVFDGQTALLVGIKDSAFDQNEGGVSYLVNRPVGEVHTQIFKRAAAHFTKEKDGAMLILGQRFAWETLKTEALNIDFQSSESIEAVIDDMVRHDLRSDLQEMRSALPRKLRTFIWAGVAITGLSLAVSACQIFSAISLEEKITAHRLEAFHYRNSENAADQHGADLQRELDDIRRCSEWVQRNYHAQQLVQELLNAVPNEVALDGLHVQAMEGLSQAKLKFTLYGAEEAQRAGLREMEARLYHLGYEIGRRDDPVAASGRRGGVIYAWDVILPTFGA